MKMSLVTRSLSNIDLIAFFLSFIPLLHIKALALDTTISSLSLSNTINVAGNETDFHALLAFKSNIFPEYQQALSSWNESLHFCHWEGVKCGRRHERVTFIDLGSKGLTGSLSPYIGNLSFLRELNLFNNTFIGEIPKELGNLFRLQILSLSINNFEGKFPTSLSRCSNLRHLSAAKNKLVGEFPKELGYSMPRLISLILSKNNLTGGLPPSIGNLTSLVVFGATYNQLGGSIPNTLGQLKILRELWLGFNQISEYGLGSQMSTSGDVYSYGILLLEMITRKRPTDKMFEADLNLRNFTRIALPQRVMEIVDPMLLTEEKNGSKMMEYLISVLEIGLACSTESPKNRMSIDTVLRELHLAKNNILKADMDISYLDNVDNSRCLSKIRTP